MSRATSSLTRSVRLGWQAGGRRTSAPACVARRQFSVEAYSYNTPAFLRAQAESLEWDKLGFNIRTMNGHVRYQWEDGVWDEGTFVPAPYELMHINAGVLHYGVAIFEGLKAFESQDGAIRVCNPGLNAARMKRGAERLLMPEVPESLFVGAVKEAVRRNAEFVPPFGAPASMYVRPLLFASGPMLGLAPLATKYTFLVTVTPTGSYFSTKAGQEEAGVKALVSEDYDRAAPCGTGGVKAAGNYAADLAPVHSCQAAGFNTTLYLDARERKYVEEFSVCNFVGVTHDGVYVTPSSPTILASTTNKMLMELARRRGIKVEERPVDFEKEMLSFAEVGMCGTAAVVVKVAQITRGEQHWHYPKFDLIGSLRAELVGIQTGEIEDTLGWMTEICSSREKAATTLSETSEKIVGAGQRGETQFLGSEAMHGQERRLLEYVVGNATAGDPESVLNAMDSFWSKTLPSKDMTSRWNMRGQVIEERLVARLEELKSKDEPARVLELGTYCGYSAVRIARNLPEGATLLSVEMDPLFAAIATKIVELAGLQNKVKIWIGTVHSESLTLKERLQDKPADFLLCDHSKERYLPDLQLLESLGVIDSKTFVVGDCEVYPGDGEPPVSVNRNIQTYFEEKNNFNLVSSFV